MTKRLIEETRMNRKIGDQISKEIKILYIILPI